MINLPRRFYRGDTRGVSWPDTGNSNRNNVEDVFGPRRFAPHIPTVGFDYDFHRGIDVDLALGDPLYSSVQGSITRFHWTHFGWEALVQLNAWNKVDPSGVFSVAIDVPSTRLVLDITNASPPAYPFADTPRLQRTAEPVVVSDDWVMEAEFDSLPPALVGNSCGIGIIDPFTGENIRMQQDGVDILALGDDSLGPLVGGSLSASRLWLRIEQLSGTVNWQYSNDGATWTTLVSDTPTFTDTTRSVFVPWIYIDWDSALERTYELARVNYVDANTIGRFGNWVQIADQNNRRVLNLHMREPIVAKGDRVNAGKQVGTAGQTGFDSRSGRILSPHVHIELIDNNDYFYANDEPINPLKPTFYPRANVDNNVTVVVTEENDPNGDACWRLNISVAREDQDFDMNEITFAGSVATRTVNFDTRAGLNPDPDIPDFDGVYLVAYNFNTASLAYELDVFFEKAVVGSGGWIYNIRDTEGTLLASDSLIIVT